MHPFVNAICVFEQLPQQLHPLESTACFQTVKCNNMNFCVFKQLPPPNIDFVLPSPTIGLPSSPVIDPPWLPHYKSKVAEVTINQEEAVSIVSKSEFRF